MAFNFRATNEKEIINKKKKYSQEASLVYSYVKKEYGEVIVLDPTTDFKKIKIPRIVEKTDGIAVVKRKLAAKIDISQLDISFGNGSGSGGSSINAEETAKQENATRFVCEQYIDGSGMPSGDKIAEIYPNYDDAWHATFEMQAKALKGWLKSDRGYEYSRDSGIMPYIEGIAKNKCGVATKDSWNPADIYIVKKSKTAEIKAEIKRIGDLPGIPKEQKLDMLNEYMRKKFISKELVGISLKKLGRTAKLEETNVSKLQTLKDITIINDSIRLELDLNDKGEFTTGELAFKIKAEGHEVNVQVRAFSGGVRESTQMDMTGQGAAAKLGKVSSREAIDPFLSKHNLSRRMGTELPQVGKWTETKIKEYVAEQDKLKNLRIGGSRINWGTSNWNLTLRQAIELEKENNRTASQLSSKLQCFQWITILNEIEKKGELANFLTVLYYGAKKQYDKAGPFLKIS